MRFEYFGRLQLFVFRREAKAHQLINPPHVAFVNKKALFEGLPSCCERIRCSLVKLLWILDIIVRVAAV